MNTIDYYRSIAEASSRMVSAARAGDWDALVHAEEECARRVADTSGNFSCFKVAPDVTRMNAVSQ